MRHLSVHFAAETLCLTHRLNLYRGL